MDRWMNKWVNGFHYSHVFHISLIIKITWSSIKIQIPRLPTTPSNPRDSL